MNLDGDTIMSLWPIIAVIPTILLSWYFGMKINRLKFLIFALMVCFALLGMVMEGEPVLHVAILGYMVFMSWVSVCARRLNTWFVLSVAGVALGFALVIWG